MYISADSTDHEKFVLSKSHLKRVWGFCRYLPKLSLYGIYIPNGCKPRLYSLGCKHFKILLKLFYENNANSNKKLRKSKKGLLVRKAF